MVTQRYLRSLLQFLLRLLLLLFVNLDFRRCKRRALDKLQVGVVDDFAREVEEGLLELVIGFGAYLVVLQVLLAVEYNALRLHLAVLHINLVAAEYDGDVFTHACEVSMPGWDVLICKPCGDIEHDDGALSVDTAIKWRQSE